MIAFEKLFELISEGYKEHLNKIRNNKSFSSEYKNRLIYQLDKHKKLNKLHRLPKQLQQIDKIIKMYGLYLITRMSKLFHTLNWIYYAIKASRLIKFFHYT